MLTVFIVSGCTEGNNPKSSDTETVKIVDAHGEIDVPFKPKRVVSLDSRTFETLDSWNIDLVAACKSLVPEFLSYRNNDDIKEVGRHRDPNLEVIAEVTPDLVIVGQRFVGFYDEIKELLPGTAVIDLEYSSYKSDANGNSNIEKGFTDSITTLGKIFDKENEAEALVKSFTDSIAAVKNAYNKDQTVMAVNISSGKIGYIAPNVGRFWGQMFKTFEWNPALNQDGTNDHQGDDISIEAIAQSNPYWILVLDREASFSEAEKGNDYVPAKDVIENAPALKDISAVTNQRIIYAPNDTYTNESIQTYIETFALLVKAFNK